MLNKINLWFFDLFMFKLESCEDEKNYYLSIEASHNILYSSFQTISKCASSHILISHASLNALSVK